MASRRAKQLAREGAYRKGISALTSSTPAPCQQKNSSVGRISCCHAARFQEEVLVQPLRCQLCRRAIQQSRQMVRLILEVPFLRLVPQMHMPRPA